MILSAVASGVSFCLWCWPAWVAFASNWGDAGHLVWHDREQYQHPSTSVYIVRALATAL